MGVPYLYINLYKKFSKKKNGNLVISKEEYLRSLQFDENEFFLLFDYNSLIHPCVHTVLNSIDLDLKDLNSEEIENRIIDFVINFTQNIINDLKMRFSYFTTKNVKIFIDGVAPFGKILQQRERRFKSKLIFNKGKIFDTNAISPGTKFMDKLVKKISQKLEIIPDVSDGEAEHKIFRYIKESEIKNCIIYGLDADLIVLSLLQKTCHVILQRQISEDNYEFFDIDILKKCIIKEYKFTNDDFLDWTFLTFLLGNDFIKKLSFLNINRLSEITWILKNLKTKTKKTFIKEDLKINFDFFEKILFELQRIEENSYNELEKDNLPTNSEELYIYNKDFVRFKTKNYDKRYYFYYGIKDSEINELCHKYINNLIWNLYYYLNDEPKTIQFFDLKCSPLIKDLIKYIKNDSFKLVEKKVSKFTVKEQLDFILPENRIQLKRPILDAYNCAWLWQSTLIINEERI